MIKNIAAIVILMTVASCGTSSPEIKPRKVSSYQPVDTGPALTYEQYREYSDVKAKRLGGEEYEQRLTERAEGNRALHKRFLLLDRNHDGKLSYEELGGMD